MAEYESNLPYSDFYGAAKFTCAETTCNKMTGAKTPVCNRHSLSG